MNPERIPKPFSPRLGGIEMARPLEGIRILDFTHVLAGPFATRVLGDLGADVVKVNATSRAVGVNSSVHPYYMMWNRNKRALSLEMSQPSARETARQLCDKADVVIDNFSVGVLDRWGIGYEEVQKTNPGVVYVQMSGMGEGGPWSNFVTYAPTIHALAGLTYLTSTPDRQDMGLGYSYNDHMAGLHAVVGLLSCLASREQSGRGQRIDLSQFEVGVNFAGTELLDCAANGRSAEPTGNRPAYTIEAPHGCYRCSGEQSPAVEDERWVAIACTSDAQWESLRTVMGNPAWAADSRYAATEGRVADADKIDAEIARWTIQYTPEDIMQRCQAVGVPAGVVQSGRDLVENDPQLKHTRFLRQLEGVPEFGETFADALPMRFEKTPCETYERVRAIGEDNEAVLGEWLGMSPEDVKRGKDSGWL